MLTLKVFFMSGFTTIYLCVILFYLAPDSVCFSKLGFILFINFLKKFIVTVLAPFHLSYFITFFSSFFSLKLTLAHFRGI